VSAKAIMVWGCTSDAGKSFLATALCRWFSDQGLRTAPFKAQNMSNNARVAVGAVVERNGLGLHGRAGVAGGAGDRLVRAFERVARVVVERFVLLANLDYHLWLRRREVLRQALLHPGRREQAPWPGENGGTKLKERPALGERHQFDRILSRHADLEQDFCMLEVAPLECR